MDDAYPPPALCKPERFQQAASGLHGLRGGREGVCGATRWRRCGCQRRGMPRVLPGGYVGDLGR